jgi:hypothetical protein
MTTGDTPVSQFWDQPRIAREFGVSVNTVQSAWRNATLRTIREHLAAAGLTETDLAMPAEQLTRLEWETARRRLGLRPLRLPRIALPLPDAVMGNKPGWTEATIGKWADDTDRRDDQGRLCRASPPGRPAGSVEQQPRRRRSGTVATSATRRAEG